MDSSIFLGGSLLGAVVAGAVALFAPCCISVMLPSYFASSMQNRRVPVAMTALFGAGIATVILPLAMGAVFLRRLLVEAHGPLFVGGGVLLLGLAVYLFWGGQLRLPMPGRKAGKPTGPFGVYSLGVFSGVASSCCAPVLAGVIALSGVASSFAFALALGGAYVVGMVAPLFFISLAWTSRDWTASRLFRPRAFTWRVGPIARTVSGTNLASGTLLGVMGGLMVWVGLAGEATPPADGWQARVSVWLQNLGRDVADSLSWVPGWLVVLVVLIVGRLLWRRVRKELGTDRPTDSRSASVLTTEGDRDE